MRLIWTFEAREDLIEIISYIMPRNAQAAADLYLRIRDTADRLPDYPEMYRLGRAPGTREAIVHPNYLLIYRVEEDAVRIISLIHTRQRYP